MKRIKYPLVHQHDHNDCAAACVATILHTYRYRIALYEVKQKMGSNRLGNSVHDIVSCLQAYQFDVKALRVPLKDLDESITLPAIAQVSVEGQQHFVVIHKIQKHNIIVGDSACGIVTYKKHTFQEIYTNVLIMMIPKAKFEYIKSKQTNLWQVTKTLILPHKKLFLQIICISSILTLFGIIHSFFAKIIMDQIIPYNQRDYLLSYSIFFMSLILIQNLFILLRQYLVLFVVRKINIPLLLGFYHHVLHLPYKYIKVRKVGDFLTRFQDAITIQDTITNMALTLIIDVCLSIVMGILLFYLNATLFLILVVMLSIQCISIFVTKKTYQRLNHRQMESNAMLQSKLIETLENMETIKAQHDEKEQLFQIEKKFVKSLKIGFKEGKLQMFHSFVVTTSQQMFQLLFLIVGALYIMDKQMTFGDFLVFQTLSQYFSSPIQNLVQLQFSFQESHVALLRLDEIMREPSEITLNENKQNIRLFGDITFHHVAFAFQSSYRPLESIHLTIKEKQCIAIIGESGSGKSTLIKLLLQFYTNYEGSIRFGKHELQDMHAYHVRKQIAYVPQQVELFSTSILENLKVGNTDASFEAITTACELVGFDQVVNRLEHRYFSFVEENGSNLSLGERQKLAMARALVKPARYYIFDEVTSHLDVFSEQMIQSLIFNHLQNTTRIVVAHRLRSIQRCDCIFVLADGKILEKGNHQQLMANKQKYYAMYQEQNGGNYE